MLFKAYKETTKEDIENYLNLRPDIPVPKNPRQVILDLGLHITDRMVDEIKPEDPEYYSLSLMVSDEAAKVLLKMQIRKRYTIEEVAELAGMSVEEVQPLLDEACHGGVLEYWTDNGFKEYLLPPFIIGSGEYSVMHMDRVEKNPERAYFFERMTTLPNVGMIENFPPGGAGVGMHVVPVEHAIEACPEAVGVEKISYWLDKYDKFASMPCVCRRSADVMGEGGGADPQGWCFLIGGIADYAVECLGGKFVTSEEVMRVIQMAEERGYVHQVVNMDGPDGTIGICNCDVNTCKALGNTLRYNAPNFSRSSFVAKVDPEKCVACGGCVEVCPAGAPKLGQKLCTRNGAIDYPKHELPDDVAWGPHKWDLHYRDNNRINCYDTGTSPCKTACPAHISVQGYLRFAAQGKYREALELIKKENPFPAICGRVCNRRCEDACTRGTVDEAVAIDEVKKFIAEQDLKAETRFVPKVLAPRVYGEFDDKIAIIGGGPAGLSCAYYLATTGYKPTVFEKESTVGGMMMHGLPDFRLEKDVVQAEIDIIKTLGVEFRTGVEVGKDVTISDLRKQGYKAFYVAIGLQSGGKLGISGDDSEGVMAGIDFMRKATGGEDIKLNGNVVVIGGGNIACDVARTAVRCGAESVSMYCLESYDDMPCGPEDRSECERDGIDIHAGWGQTDIENADGKCTGINFRKCLSVMNEEGRFDPRFDEAQTEHAKADYVFYCIGQKADWKRLLLGTRVEFNGNKTVIADPVTYQTAQEDIFVGGDIYTGQKFIIDAIAAGKKGAYSVHRFVRNGSLTIGRNLREYIELDKENIVIDEDTFDNTPRQQIGYNEALKKTFHDDRILFTEEQIKKETARCLGCGTSVVDENKCLGCGVCTVQCKFDAIHLHRERPECSNLLSREEGLPVIMQYAQERAIRIQKKSEAANL